jgi:hypothetical protein
MASRNDHTGDLIMSKKAGKTFSDNYSKIFGEKKPNARGKFIQDKETGEMVPASQYHHKKSKSENSKRSKTLHMPAVHWFKEYKSPTTGEEITSAAKEREHLKLHGKRLMEPIDQEKKAADAIKAEQEKKFDKFVDEAVEKTAMDIEYNRVEVDKSGYQNLF